MRFLMLVNATRDLEAGAMPKELISALASAHEEPARAGTRLDASGLQPSSKSRYIEHSGAQRSVVDGPFVETKELIAGHGIPDRHPGSQRDDEAREFLNGRISPCRVGIGKPSLTRWDPAECDAGSGPAAPGGLIECLGPALQRVSGELRQGLMQPPADLPGRSTGPGLIRPRGAPLGPS
jgi:hypothetical protein